MFKSWQIFVFSLIPLALVFGGVIIGSIYFDGGDSQPEVFPTPQGGATAAPVFSQQTVTIVFDA